MTALALKIRDFWSDLWLDLELAWDRIKPVAPVAPAVPAPAKPITPPAVATSVKAPTKLPLSLRMLRLGGKGRLFFFDQLSTLIGSGVSLIDSLNVIKAQTKSKTVKQLYAEMIHHINAGMGLADAMSLFPHIFPKMQVALIEAGEKSGNLKLVFADMVEDLESGQDFLRKVTGAMAYPLILVFLAITLVTGMMVFVIPRVAGMYKQAHVELPRLTQAVIAISNFVHERWLFLLVGIVGAIVLLWLFFVKTRFGKKFLETLVGFVPMFGQIAREKNLTLIAGNMAMLLKSGVLISDAFEITGKTIDSLHYQEALEKVRHGVMMGRSVSESMGLKNIEDKHFREDPLFPLQFSQLVHIGETTGTISVMLLKLRQNFQKSIDYKLKNISTVLEPIMIFFVAALVGSILLAVMLPFFYIGTTIK